MQWSDVQLTTREIARQRPEILDAWLYLLCTSGKMRDLISLQRAPSQDELSSLVGEAGSAAELVAEYYETSRRAREIADAEEGP